MKSHIFLEFFILAGILYEECYARGGKAAKRVIKFTGGRSRGQDRGNDVRRQKFGVDDDGFSNNCDGGGVNYENAPCVGLCYHNKLKCFNDENCEDFDKGWPHNYKEFGPPCVGICYLLRELNMSNPGYQFQHTGVK